MSESAHVRPLLARISADMRDMAVYVTIRLAGRGDQLPERVIAPKPPAATGWFSRHTGLWGPRPPMQSDWLRNDEKLLAAQPPQRRSAEIRGHEGERRIASI